MPSTSKQKLDCVLRELRIRYRVYPRFVSEGRMTQAIADRELAAMEDIAADYREKVEREG